MGHGRPRLPRALRPVPPSLTARPRCPSVSPLPHSRSPLLDPRNGPDWDLPRPAAPPQTYVVASLPRSGSTLLCRLLWGTGRVGAPKEYLNPMQLRDWSVRHGSRWDRVRNAPLQGKLVGALAGRWGRRGQWSDPRLTAHLAAVRARRSSGGWFGMKLHHHHLIRWQHHPTLAALLAAARWIRIEREDHLAQAVSWELALQTGQWASWQPAGRRPPRYSARRIARRLRALDRGRRFWDDFLASRSPVTLTHEELVRAPEATVRRVLAELGVDGAAAVAVPAPELRRQGNSRNRSWMERFRREQGHAG